MSSLTTLKITVGWCEESAIFGIYILNCFLEKGSNSTFLAFFPNDKEISKEPEEGEQEITKKCWLYPLRIFMCYPVIPHYIILQYFFNFSALCKRCWNYSTSCGRRRREWWRIRIRNLTKASVAKNGNCCYSFRNGKKSTK